MSRDKRTLLVLVIAVLTAGLASFGVYRAIQRIPVREIEVAHTFVVAAARELPTGTRLGAADLKLVPWPNSAPVAGAFTKIDDAVNRGVVMSVQENEPVTEAKLAPIEAGAGITPVIPDGMRAISVRVNEVIGVAGFVTPGTRVDVFGTLQQQPTSQTRIIVSNVQVLAAGTRYEQDKNKPGEPIPSSVVTLLVTPQDAERVVLASTEGQVMLALRNPLDVAPTDTPGTRMSTLFGGLELPLAPPPAVAPLPVVVPKKPAPVVIPPPPVQEPRHYTVEAIRGAKRTAEVVQLEGTHQ